VLCLHSWFLPLSRLLSLEVDGDMDAVQTVSPQRSAFLVKSLVMWFTINLTSTEQRQAGELNKRRREITHSPLHGNASNLTSYNLHCNNHCIKRKKKNLSKHCCTYTQTKERVWGWLSFYSLYLLVTFRRRAIMCCDKAPYLIMLYNEFSMQC